MRENRGILPCLQPVIPNGEPRRQGVGDFGPILTGPGEWRSTTIVAAGKQRRGADWRSGLMQLPYLYHNQSRSLVHHHPDTFSPQYFFRRTQSMQPVTNRGSLDAEESWHFDRVQTAAQNGNGFHRGRRASSLIRCRCILAEIVRPSNRGLDLIRLGLTSSRLTTLEERLREVNRAVLLYK